MAKNFLQVFEYEQLRYSENNDFTKSQFDALVDFNVQHNNKYFTVINKGIQFKQYVGVINVGGLTIEILPKVDRNTKADKDLWQGVLLNMLAICKKIKVDNVSTAHLKKRHNSILEVYFELYLNEVESLIRKGLIKRYRKTHSNQKALKGKLIFNKNLQKNLVHKERFFCEHQVYDKDHLIHSIIFKALKILERIGPPVLKDRLNRLLFQMMDFKEIPINESDFTRVRLNRKSQVYSDALDIAKMLILNYSPNVSSGKDKMLTLLFDMNKLWEEFIYQVLLKYKKKGIKVQGQRIKKFWEWKKIAPDIVVTNLDTKEKIIIDTKWKMVENSQPGDEDLKQMFAYNLLWGAEKSILLYPKVAQVDSKFGEYTFKPVDTTSLPTVDFKKKRNTCKLGFVSVIDEYGLKENKRIVEEIFDKLYV